MAALWMISWEDSLKRSKGESFEEAVASFLLVLGLFLLKSSLYNEGGGDDHERDRTLWSCEGLFYRPRV